MKTKKTTTLLAGIFILLMAFNIGWTQDLIKTDRVPEVEAELRKEIIEHVARLLPKESFTVTVKVIPLKRLPSSQAQIDVLPFYESGTENDLYEEWDDPSISYYVLINRVKEVTVSLSLHKSYTLKNEANFRDDLFKSVGLISGRDQLDIKMVEMQAFTKTTSLNDFNWYYISGVILVITFFIATFILLNRLAQSKIPSPSQNATSSNTQASTSSIQQSAASLGSAAIRSYSHDTSSHNNSIHGDITFTDSLKLNSYLKEKITLLVSKEGFPELSTLKTLEEFCEIDQPGFSYLISHFPEHAKKMTYNYGRNQNWIKAFSRPGVATKNVLIYINRLLQDQAYSKNPETEKLFIAAWRLGNQLKEYISVISQEESKYLLFNLPKNLSLPIARNMFPGEWAFLFAESKVQINITPERIQELISLAQKIKPNLDLELITTYTNQEELLDYLKQCSPEEEREIYQSYRGSTPLSNLRSPFYIFFEMEESERLLIFKKFDIRSWAFATFGISREFRSKVDVLMSEKEKFLFKIYLTDLDKSKPNTEIISEIREVIAHEASQKHLFASSDSNEVFGNAGYDEKAA